MTRPLRVGHIKLSFHDAASEQVELLLRELQTITRTDLALVRDLYDRKCYKLLRALASQIMTAQTGIPVERIETLLKGETGHAMPTVDVRDAAFDEHSRILMAREVADAGRWTLPDSWADVNLTAAENVVKEIQEEGGFEVQVHKLSC